MTIYTRRGDSGQTGLFGGGRVSKAHARVDAYGSVDELNSVVGWALTRITDDLVRERLRSVQHDLFSVGAELATPPTDEGRTRPRTPGLPDGRAAEMERWIDEADEELSPLTEFVLPGGSEAAAALHVARTVCRRAERSVVALGGEAVSAGLVRYLNRLSDLLFTWARLENLRAGRADVTWEKPRAERA